MAVQVYARRQAVVLETPGKRSAQLLWPENAPGASVTITYVRDGTRRDVVAPLPPRFGAGLDRRKRDRDPADGRARATRDRGRRHRSDAEGARPRHREHGRGAFRLPDRDLSAPRK